MRHWCQLNLALEVDPRKQAPIIVLRIWPTDIVLYVRTLRTLARVNRITTDDTYLVTILQVVLGELAAVEWPRRTRAVGAARKAPPQHNLNPKCP